MKVYQKTWIPDHSRGKPPKDEDHIQRGPVMVAKADHDAEVVQLQEANKRLCALILQADPWVQSRYMRHVHKATIAKQPYYKARHSREAEYCEGWLAEAVHFLPPERPLDESAVRQSNESPRE